MYFNSPERSHHDLVNCTGKLPFRSLWYRIRKKEMLEKRLVSVDKALQQYSRVRIESDFGERNWKPLQAEFLICWLA